MMLNKGLPPVAVHDLVIQPREHDLVVGTHGRSIYIANIDALEQINDSILKQPLFVVDPGTVRQRMNYVETATGYQAVPVTNLKLAWTVSAPGTSTIRFQSADGSMTFTELRDSSETGLNYLNTELLVDSVNAENYRRWVEKNGKGKEAVQVAGGKLAPLPGEYRIEIQTAADRRYISLVIKPRK